MSRRKRDALDEALENDPDFQELVRLLKCQTPEQRDRLEEHLAQDCEASPLSGGSNESKEDDR
ncbi:MAG: hypothetical protein AB1646_21330 [Thermodesulfobacteriota bacterium]